MCCLPPSEVLLTFHTSPQLVSQSSWEPWMGPSARGRSPQPHRSVSARWGLGLSVVAVVLPVPKRPPRLLVPTGVWGVARATSCVGAGVLTTRRCRGEPMEVRALG